MPDLLIALLPPLPGEDWTWREIAAELAAYHHDVHIVSDCPAETVQSELDLAGMWVAHCAMELARDPARPPVLLVAWGGAGRMLAALGFAQRASRRRVAGYVFVDADVPKSGVQDWPDAPVTYIGGRESALAALRGWEVLPDGDIAADLRQVAADSA